MMAGRGKFDFVGAFRDSPVTGINSSSFFALAPSLKRDICRQLVPERTRTKGKGKGKGKKVTIEEVQDEQEVSAVATDQDLGDVANFFTRGVVRTEQGRYRISRILVEAGSVVNLMPIHLLWFIGAKLQKAGGMVIRTATMHWQRSSTLRMYVLPKRVYHASYVSMLSRRSTNLCTPSYLSDIGCRLSRQQGITQGVGIISCISMGPASEFLEITAHK